MTGLATSYSLAMRWLYLACIVLCVLSIVCMTGLIFTGVVMRYAFEMGARFSEPMSIFFTVQLTMYGAAACYRAKAHLQIHFFVNLMPEHLRIIPRRLVELLMAGIAVFMIYFGLSLAEMTWFQAYPEFDYVRVGFVYSAIPGSGLVMLLFVIETAIIGPPEDDEDEELQRAIDHADHERRTLG